MKSIIIKYKIPIIIVSSAIIGFLIIKIMDAKKFLPIWVNYFGTNSKLKSPFTRGVRNNNPGNIRITTTLWKGEVPKNESDDKSFKQFYNYVYGTRAIIVLLFGYMKKGYNTIEKIINRYAPPSENKTSSYVKNVSDYVGIAPNVIVPKDKETIKKLVQAIIRSENGKVLLSDTQFNSAWKMV